uniref:SPAC22F8.04 protein n=1 Tax=Fopius arisanus TaxID=64838 RepID=A0A0C9R175_9HYME
MTMKIGLLKNFLHCFSLKQGTILIAILQLFISGIVMTFFLLALAHAMDIQEMVARDSEDALEREALEEMSSMHLNTKRMDIAHHNATGITVYFYFSFIFFFRRH